MYCTTTKFKYLIIIGRNVPINVYRYWLILILERTQPNISIDLLPKKSSVEMEGPLTSKGFDLRFCFAKQSAASYPRCGIGSGHIRPSTTKTMGPFAWSVWWQIPYYSTVAHMHSIVFSTSSPLHQKELTTNIWEWLQRGFSGSNTTYTRFLLEILIIIVKLPSPNQKYLSSFAICIMPLGMMQVRLCFSLSPCCCIREADSLRIPTLERWFKLLWNRTLLLLDLRLKLIASFSFHRMDLFNIALFSFQLIWTFFFSFIYYQARLGRFGLYFTLFNCLFYNIRQTDDPLNPILAGGFARVTRRLFQRDST